MDRDGRPNRDVLVLDYCLYNRLSVIGLFLVFRYERLLRLGLRLWFGLNRLGFNRLGFNRLRFNWFRFNWFRIYRLRGLRLLRFFRLCRLWVHWIRLRWFWFDRLWLRRFRLRGLRLYWIWLGRLGFWLHWVQFK